VLPEVPSGVGRIEVEWAVGTVPSSSCSNAFWIFSSGLEAQSPADLQTLLGDWILTPLNDLLSLVPSDVSPSTCRLSTYGVTPLTIVVPGPIASGAGGSCSPLNAALVLSWRSDRPGQSARSTTWLPLPSDDVDSGRRLLTTPAYGSAQGTAFAYINHMNALTVGGGQPVEFVTLHRRTAHGSASVAGFSPVIYGHPSRFIGTLDRRIRSRGRAPSL
jgi:hypothetical protein